MTEPTTGQIAWLAGIVDGEGCITAGAYKTNNARADKSVRYRLSLFVSVTNTNEDIILTAHDLFERLSGVRPVLHVHDSQARVKQHLTQKQCYRTHVAGGIAVSRVLQAILPYLVGKRRQAELLLLIIEHRKQVCAQTGRKNAACRIEADSWLRSQLATLRIENQRGPVRESKSLV